MAKSKTETPITAQPATPTAKPFPLEVNEARGEVALWVGKIPIVIAAEMGRMAAISSRLQCKSFNDLFLRLTGAEVAATVAGIELLTVRGKPIEAIEALKIPHLQACSNAFSAAIAHHFEDDRGNG